MQIFGWIDLGGFSIISGDKKKVLISVGLSVRNLIFKAMDDCLTLEILEEGILWHDPRSHILIFEAEKEKVIEAFHRTFYCIRQLKDWFGPLAEAKLTEGEDDRHMVMKVLYHLVKILKEYDGDTVIFRDDYCVDAEDDYPELYKLK